MANRFPAFLVLFLFAFTSMTHVISNDLNSLESVHSVERTSGTGRDPASLPHQMTSTNAGREARRKDFGRVHVDDRPRRSIDEQER